MSKIESSYTRILLVLPSFTVSSLYVNQNPFNNFTPCALDCNLYLIIDIKDYRLVGETMYSMRYADIYLSGAREYN